MIKKAFVVLLVSQLLYICSATNCIQHLLQRSYDGSCNNLLFPNLGRSHSLFKNGQEGREAYPWQHVPVVSPLPTYADIDSLPSDGPRANARDVSNLVSQRHNPDATDENRHSVFSSMFGQFVNHDLENNQVENSHNPLESRMVVYLRDLNDYSCFPTTERPFPHDFRCEENNTILTSQIKFSQGSFATDGTFKAINNATSYLDLHTVYGPSQEVNSKLRLKTAGKLLSTPTATISVNEGSFATFNKTLTNLLPTYQISQAPVDSLYSLLGDPNHFFVAGDERLNENMALTFFHTIWMREHNKVCDELIENNILFANFPVLFDEVIFQEARKITIAKYQHIIYEQYFPSVYGQYFADKLGSYNQYDITVDPSTSLLFAGAAFRYGHFTPRQYFALDECGLTVDNGEVAANQNTKQIYLGFQNPFPPSLTPLGRIGKAGSLDNIARGLINELTAPNYLTADNTFRNFTSNSGVVDLVTFDIARGRFNNIPNYQKVRTHHHKSGNSLVDKIYGNDDCPASLETSSNDDPIECFSYITSDLTTATQLKQLYRKINLIDAIIGIQAEDNVGGTSFGRTGGNIIADEFKRTRAADRFFYTELIKNNAFSYSVKQEILSTTMGKILQRNLETFELVENPFVVPENYRQQLVESCQ